MRSKKSQITETDPYLLFEDPSFTFENIFQEFHKFRISQVTEKRPFSPSFDNFLTDANSSSHWSELATRTTLVRTK